jgi:trimethylamine--corrinoid protein Co-methyltransferase
MSGGSPEQGLISSGCAQLGLYFDLPFGTACGMTDANMPDFQAGAERAHTLMPPALAGSNLIYEAAGMYSSLLGVCPESLILDNDVLGATLRAVRGIEVMNTRWDSTISPASAWVIKAITWARIIPLQ